MSWFPIGPDFVFAPREPDFKRLSRRNEWGQQGLVYGIAIDPFDPATIYVCERPSSGGTTAFRTETEGALWSPIADSLHQGDPRIDPMFIAVHPHPAHNNIVYLATFGDAGVYVSTDRGDSWGPRRHVGGRVRKLIIDPRTAADPATTVIYAATDAGVFRSPDGGVSWTSVLTGDVWSLIAHFPGSGTPRFFAGVWRSGVFHTTDPTAAANWTNLNAEGIGLPVHTGSSTSEPDGNFNAILLSYCPRQPNRVYAWMAKRACDADGTNCSQVTAALYTTASPLGTWSEVSMTSPPGPAYGFYVFDFVVAPNSPGDGLNDVLMFCSIGLHRSTDGGRTWTGDAIGFHADQHEIVFFPANPPAGVIPATYLGCDGGIAMSTRFADPAFSITPAPSDFNQGLSVANTGVWQNLNHGKQSSAVYQYTSHPAVGALGYIGCQDTGLDAGTGSLGWREIADADGGQVAAALGTDGVKLWGQLGAFGDWPGFRILMWTDNGSFSPPWANVTLGAGGPLLNSSSNFVLGLDENCLTGVVVRDSERTLASAITAAGEQPATPSSMAGIAIGTILLIDTGSSQERLTVTGTTATTFSANFGVPHAAGVPILLERAFVARLDRTAIASQISQDFGQQARRVAIVAFSPVNPDILYAATDDQRLWMTSAGSSAGSGTVWVEITGGKPSSLQITGIAIDGVGNVYVLLRSSITTSTGGEFGTIITSPLFRIVGNDWIHQPCSGLVPPGNNIGNLLSHPAQPDTLYASHGARVSELRLEEGAWEWRDISSGLPGQWIYDLWIGDIGPAGSPKALLRAAIPTRGIWEKDVSAGPGESGERLIDLYVRDHLLDQGWLTPSPEGMANPHDPTRRVWHYQCADIKIDARQPGSATTAPFFQTDPEGSTLPITHVLFDQLKDNSHTLPQGNRALVHVQVHNRSRVGANNVRVWAIYCNASAGVPGLNVSPSQGNSFAFWDQFTVTGQIVPALPADSPWRSVGPPQTLSGIDAARPRVASWNWEVPTLPSGDPGHYCMAVFVHSALSPVGESSMNVDEMTPRNRQVGQKNLHIGPPLPAGPGPGAGSGGPGGIPGIGIPGMREYLEFHNPTAAPREATLVFDLRTLPPEFSVSLRLTRLETTASLAESLSGIARQREPTPQEVLLSGGARWLSRLARLLRWLACWIENLVRWLAGRPLHRCRFGSGVRLPPFDPTIYEAAPSALVEIRGVRIPGFGFVAAMLDIRNNGTLEQGSEYTFDVQQVAGGNVMGGSTYVVRLEGDKRRSPRVVVPAHDTSRTRRELERIEREAEPLKYVPPAVREITEEREREQGRKE